RANFLVARAGAEEKSAGAGRGAAEVFCAGFRNPAGSEFFVLAERNAPCDFPTAQVDRAQRAPSGFGAGIIFRVEKFWISDVLVRGPRAWGRDHGSIRMIAIHQVVEQI